MFNHTFLARLLLIGLGIVGLYTAASGLALKEVSLIPCVFHLLTGLVCPGCGMTRACLALMHGQFSDAWGYHPYSFFVVGVAIAAAFFPLWLKKAWACCSPVTQNVIAVGGIVLCLSIWIHKLWTY